ncbi:hypothetical protein SAMN04489712_10241 [Thermomonospora echinospora]|uniref:Uncharacterized protein n=1 Tax=Thermomonospora echinospora TaxID=1992 RepID=A0A1H5UXD0_9ACTN|nr:hypothetical protein [Thermomonospora echinospora]SEF78867.1 hypothetical protein SAMN04489712_10241 [Thermomonospora echinospora]
MTAEPEASVLHDVLRVYDHRFLGLDGRQRSRLVQGTRHVLGDGLSDEVRAALPSAYRMRAFCIQHGLDDELERLIRDETEGRRSGAVVVGGRVYAIYPYLRGVPRKDADITGEVQAGHRLDGVLWQGERLRVRGWAALERVEAREVVTELILRERTAGTEHRFPTTPWESGFEAMIEFAGVGAGRWDAYVAVTVHGVRRRARFGRVRDPLLPTEPMPRRIRVPEGTVGATAYFTKGGHLAVKVGGVRRPVPLRTRILRRLTR